MSKASSVYRGLGLILAIVQGRLLLAGSPVDLNHLLLRDDVGKPIRASVTACAPNAGGNPCWVVGKGQPPDALAFDEVSLESPEHGPVTLKFAELSASPQVTLPRKAHLRLHTALTKSITISLYGADDRELRRPTYRFETNDKELLIPSGKWILALTAKCTAPDLYVADAQPAMTVSATKTAKVGWSLLVRIQDKEGRPVTGSAMLSDAESGAQEAQNGNGALSIAIERGVRPINGIAVRTARLDVQAPGFTPYRLGAVTAAPGEFAVRVVELRRGGRLALTVLENGDPSRNARWFLLEPAARPERNLRLKSVAEGTTDKGGRAERPSLAAGSYILRVYPPGQTNGTDDRVTIEDDGVLERTVELVAISVDGEVRRGDKPIAGSEVRLSRVFSGESPDDEADTVAKTDQDGHYSTKVYTEGEYRFIVTSEGTPAVHRKYWMPRAGRRVDFELLEGTLRGTVADDAGKAVPDATVALTDAANLHRLARTDFEGYFEFLFESAGRVSVFADKDGYKRSEPLAVEIPNTGALEPLLVTLKKFPSIRGRVEQAGGQPAPGVSIATVDQNSNPLQGAVSGADGSFELRSAPGTTLLIFSGPSCPLGWREALNSGAPNEEDSGDPFIVRCALVGAALAVILQNEDHRPIVGEAIRLRHAGRVVPDELLARHQRRFGLEVFSDAFGRLDLVSLEEGSWDLFLARGSSPSTIAAGQQNGYLLSEELRPGTVSELTVTVRPVTTRISP
jgi:hypothetical protein